MSIVLKAATGALAALAIVGVGSIAHADPILTVQPGDDVVTFVGDATGSRTDPGGLTTLAGSNGREGGGGNDVILGDSGSDRVGGGGNDVILGDSGSDRVGGGGNDVIYGGSGDD
jgi:hypothetical protein